MIRTLLELVPAERNGLVVRWVVLTVVSVLLRAAGVVVLVPLVAALFSGAPTRAWPWLGALTLATVAGWAVDGVCARTGTEIGFSVLGATQRRVADHLVQVPSDWFTPDRVATARAAIGSGGPDLVGVVANLLTPLVSAVLLPAAIAVALIPVSWPLALAAAFGFPVLLVALWGSGRVSRGADRAAEQANVALTERLVEFGRTQQALRAARRAEAERSEVGAAVLRQHGAVLRLLALQVPGQLLFGIASQLVLVLLAGVAVVQVIMGHIGVPAAIALIVVAVRYLEPFTALAELTPALETCRATLDRIRAVLRAPQLSTGTTRRSPAGPPRIVLDGVSVRYGQDGEPVLRDLRLDLAPGTTTAIVGPSGSGKTTLLALLAGLLEPTAGRVLVDGEDVARLDEESRRALVSVVGQQPYLFDGTIADNIAVGDPSAGPAAIAEVCRLARVDEITARLPDGLASRTGEAGVSLSGGERQRVSVARALLKPAPILLVDEATSALDTENEAAIAAAVSDDPRPRTRIVVAHRLAAVRHAERVLFLSDGRIVEDGTIDELRQLDGRFAAFWRHQDASEDWMLGVG